jgi:drug/metabolite transporter (DMT)-like permease
MLSVDPSAAEDLPKLTIPPINRRRIALMIIIPTFFDVFESINRNIANILLPPSVSQMLRSAIVVFTAILSVIFLKLKLYLHHKLSIAAIVLGLFFVGLSTFLKGSTNPAGNKTATQTALAITLQLIGGASGASSYVVEEKFLGDCE